MLMVRDLYGSLMLTLARMSQSRLDIIERDIHNVGSKVDANQATLVRIESQLKTIIENERTIISLLETPNPAQIQLVLGKPVQQ